MKYNVSINDDGLIRHFQMNIKLRNADLTAQNISKNCALTVDNNLEVYKGADTIEQLNMCLEISRAEYEHSFRRAERLDNKIYILLTVCAFIFVVLISAMEKGAGYSWAMFCSNGWVFTYNSILLLCIIGTIVLLGALIYSLSGADFKRYDSNLVLEYNMLSEDMKKVTRFTIMKYENAREHNNKIVTKRYRILNFCVKLLIALVAALICITFLYNFMPKDLDTSKKQVVIQETEEEADSLKQDVNKNN